MTHNLSDLSDLSEKQIEAINKAISECREQNLAEESLSFPVHVREGYKGDVMLWAKEHLDTKQVIEMLEKFPPTEISHKQNEKTIYSPFKIHVYNPARPSKYSPFEFKVGWTSGKYDLHFKVPLEKMQSFVSKSERRATDSEHHYFTGFSLREINKMRLLKYSFNTSHSTGWYGGDESLTGVDVINDFMKAIVIE